MNQADSWSLLLCADLGCFCQCDPQPPDRPGVEEPELLGHRRPPADQPRQCQRRGSTRYNVLYCYFYCFQSVFIAIYFYAIYFMFKLSCFYILLLLYFYGHHALCLCYLFNLYHLNCFIAIYIIDFIVSFTVILYLIAIQFTVIFCQFYLRGRWSYLHLCTFTGWQKRPENSGVKRLNKDVFIAKFSQGSCYRSIFSTEKALWLENCVAQSLIKPQLPPPQLCAQHPLFLKRQWHKNSS